MKHLSDRLAAIATLLLLAPLTLHAAGPGKKNPKISDDAYKGAASELVPVIIQYAHDPGDGEGGAPRLGRRGALPRWGGSG